MCEVVITSDTAISTDSSEKMKRMAIALKAVGGWISYFMGICTLALGTLTPLGTDLVTVIIGMVITLTGLVLLHLHVKQKMLSGKERIVKGVKYTGSILFIPGLVGNLVTSYAPGVTTFFSLLFLTGILIFIASICLKKIWGIKSPKKLRKIGTREADLT